MKSAASRKILIMLSDNCGCNISSLARLLPALRIPAEYGVLPPEKIRPALTERPVDALILGPGDFDLAAELSEHSYTAVMITSTGDRLRDLRPVCAAAGILLADSGQLEAALPQLLAMCTRLRTLRQYTSSLQRKLDDTRLVNRAKLLLMSRLNMSEAEAHRYIEKSAMDGCRKRREVAESIIRTYEE